MVNPKKAEAIKNCPKPLNPSNIQSFLGLAGYYRQFVEVFQMSLLRKFVGDPNSIVPLDSIEVKESLSYEKVLVEILDLQVKKYRNKEIDSFKVLWRNQEIECAIWEAEADKISRYPLLFPSVPS
ncbi:uncharacterized protein LOC129890614 [Solanum dulcamara]|uniref:uncharacterized protein LOC129890614 n=1 Tax=Solanum dulcamara TaxID=45834 RepID=UPI0024859829|nr:uncharacterized protein LOC129890614 [Solanum dulcamara]